jgi:cytochrome c
MMTAQTFFPAVCASLVVTAIPLRAVAEPSPPDSPAARKIVDLVTKAATLVDQRGKGAFTDFRKPDSDWFKGQTYLFAYDLKGNVLLNPAFPKREGTNVAGGKDANGKLFHDEIIKTAESKGSGWVDYVFPKPGGTAPSRKWTYVQRVQIDGLPGLIAAGFYPD